jgi:hypothetical protein
MIPYMVLTLETVPSCPELSRVVAVCRVVAENLYIEIHCFAVWQAPFIEEAKFQLQEEQELLQFGTYGVVRCFVFWVSIWVFPISEKLLS